MQRGTKENLATSGTRRVTGSVKLHNITATSIGLYGLAQTSCFASRFANSLDVCRLIRRNSFALWFQIAMDGRRDGLSLLVGHTPPGWWCDGSHGGSAKTHVGGWGDLPPQGGLVTSDKAGVDGKRRGEGGHCDIVGVLDRRVRRGRGYPATKEEEFKLGLSK